MGGERAQRESGDATADPVVVRRSGQGWQVGPEETADLTSAMMLADLLAADLGSPAPPPAGGRPTRPTRPTRPPGSR
jgi:hypothetical protein